LLEGVEGPFDHVAAFAGFPVEPGRSAAFASASFAVRFLIGAFRNYCLDAAAAQQLPVVAFDE
jgi:hypothetical protein